ncbi:hypothetical protein N7519_006849 [Penicillium mononematosum]|uniref:uncharacterized protein n=1 Tax=Penicillium mononematosum TaxID=268346 RepID=UPI0025490CFB|nr:uncharacterized protein N7519_006849 [Penicillium mononematosum]KAJ6185548.1 hypothetical protein N7519_006849 [Penicillium mononematosum]
MADLRVRVTVVSLAKLSAAVILASTFASGRTLVPVDVLSGPTIVPRDKGATITTTAGLPAPKLSSSCRGVGFLGGEAGLHVLSRVGGFVLEIVLDGRAHLGPVFRRPVLAETAVLANLTVPDDRPSGGSKDWAVVYHEAARKELDELLHVAGLVQLGLPRRGHRAEVIGQGSDLRGGCRRPMLSLMGEAEPGAAGQLIPPPPGGKRRDKAGVVGIVPLPAFYFGCCNHDHIGKATKLIVRVRELGGISLYRDAFRPPRVVAGRRDDDDVLLLQLLQEGS